MFILHKTSCTVNTHMIKSSVYDYFTIYNLNKSATNQKHQRKLINVKQKLYLY